MHKKRNPELESVLKSFRIFVELQINLIEDLINELKNFLEKFSPQFLGIKKSRSFSISIYVLSLSSVTA